MRERVITLGLLVALFFGVLVLAKGASEWRSPGNQQGYAPPQPIAFSHRLHAGELAIDCKFCHVAADNSRYAGIPTSDICYKCHKFVTAPYAAVAEERRKASEEKREPRPIVSEELKKLYEAMGVADPLKPVDPSSLEPIRWVRVHNLPDHVLFNHQAHVQAGVACQRCHGPVETFERMYQYETLSMGWCVHCHREVNQTGVSGRPVHASTDCAACHY